MDTMKIQRLISATGKLHPGFFYIEVVHDDKCPAIRTQSLTGCTCTPEFKKVEPKGVNRT